MKINTRHIVTLGFTFILFFMQVAPGISTIMAKESTDADNTLEIYDSEAQDTNTTSGNITTTELQTQNMMNSYIGEKRYNTGEHVMINILGGMISGALLGSMGSLSVYETDDMTASQNNFYRFAGAGGVAGAFAGGIVSIIEISNDEQFTTGMNVMRYSWYGTMGGTLIGAVGGLVPYSSSNDQDDIYNYAGMGAMAGLASGILFYVFFSPEGDTGQDDLYNTTFHSGYNPFTNNFQFNIVKRF